MTAEELVFLDVDDVIELHAAQLEVFGGGSGLRDRGLLESAVAQPQASFGEQYAHDGLFSMAAAYLFHITSNLDIRKVAGVRLGRWTITPNPTGEFGQTSEPVIAHWCERAGVPYLGLADIGHDA